MNDSLTAQDAAARHEALHPTRSFLVQAPAGSGKTALLTQRFLALLAEVAQPEQVAAITFTRKAAAEMRARVLGALEHAARGEAPDSPHLSTTRQLALAVAARDRELGWELTASPGRLRIMTIDAFCGAITRQLPWLSRFGGQPVNAPDARPHYQAAALAVLEGLEGRGPEAPAVERLLTHLDNNPARVQGLLVAMLARREHWLRHLQGVHPAALRERLQAALAAIVAQALADAEAAAPPAARQALPALAAFAAETLANEKSPSPLTACVGMAALPPAEPAALPRWLGLAHLLLTGKGEWRRQVTKREGFPPKTEHKATLEALLLELGPHTEFRLALLELRLLPASEFPDGQWLLLEALLTLLPLAVQKLRGVFAAAGEVDFSEVAMAAGRALTGGPQDSVAGRALTGGPQDSVAGRALTGGPQDSVAGRALTGGPQDSAAGRALTGGPQDSVAGRALPAAPQDSAAGGPGEAPGGGSEFPLRHLLVDEFQDTSFSQYRLLENLTAGWAGDDGRTLFLVGDPMQSIYGFREAEVGLYLKARREGIGPLPLQPLRLSVNFRSAQGVVDWLNRHFPSLLPAQENAARGAIAYSPADAARPRGAEPAVRFHPFAGRRHPEEAEQVVQLAREAQARHPGGRTAILVRARTHLAEILPALQAAGLPFQAVGIDPLAARPAVQDLLALTRALEHPADRVAWLAVLRAPWCGLTLADLTALAGESAQTTLWRRINDPATTQNLSPDGARRLARLRNVLAAALPQRGRAGLRTRVEGAWLALGGPATLAPGESAAARALLELVDSLEIRGVAPSMAALAEQAAGLKAPPDPRAGEALSVMTIHGAKGLEFDTVIVPGLGRQPPRQDKPLLRWAELPGSAGDPETLLLAPIAETGDSTDPTYQYLGRLHKTRADHEAVRLLYVAITRAIGTVHLLGHAKAGNDGVFSPASGSLLEPLWETVAGAFAELPPQPEPATHAPEPLPFPTGPLLRRLPENWTLPPLPAAVATPGPATEDESEEPPPERIEFSWAGDTARHVGTVVHAMLEYLGCAPGQGDPAAPADLAPRLTAALRRLGVPTAELDAAGARAEQAVRNTLADPTGRWLLHGHGEAQNELALTAAIGPRNVQVKMDRTFVDSDGCRWIVDYKTGGHQGGDPEQFLAREQARYAPQLERYARILRRMEPGRSIRVGLYFPLHQAWRHWEPGE